MTYILGVDDKPSLEDALEHYGVKGMKWGVRRSQAELDRAAGRSISRSALKTGQNLNKAARATGRSAKAGAKGVSKGVGATARVSVKAGQKLGNALKTTTKTLTKKENRKKVAVGASAVGAILLANRTMNSALMFNHRFEKIGKQVFNEGVK